MENNGTYDVIIIGGGIVGASVFYNLQVALPDLNILLLEKEEEVAKHQTGHNSGVIHSGIYYKPNSLKANNCKRGRELLLGFSKKYNIAHEICGKIIVANSENELETLHRIYENGIANKTQDIQLISPKEIVEIEPFCTNSLEAIHVGSAGIIDFVSFNKTLLKVAAAKNEKSQYNMGERVIDVTNISNERVRVTTNKAKYTTRFIISCAGLQSDRITEKTTGQKLDCKIVPFRGDYYELTEEAEEKVKHLIYPVPDPKFPFLGVHFTRMIHGGVECGPNAVFSFKREGYGKFSFSLQDSWESLTFPGTWKLFSKHWKYGMGEYKRALSKRVFLQSLQRLIPALTMDDIKPGRAGVRAQALMYDGKLVDDFKILSSNRSIHVVNAPSPAATSCLAIGEHILKEYVKFNQPSMVDF